MPVDAPDQLRSDGLYELFRVRGKAVSHVGRVEKMREIGGVECRVVVIGLPEEDRQKRERILVTGAKEPTIIGVGKEKLAKRRSATQKEKVYRIKLSLGIPAPEER